MVIRDDMGLEDFSEGLGELRQLNDMNGELGFSLRKTLKKLAPHNLLKKISPVQAIRRAMQKPKRSSSPAQAAAAAAAPPPAAGSPTPIPGGYMVEGNDPSGNYIAYYFPDVTSANAYNQQLTAGGGYGTVVPTPAAPGMAPGMAPGAYQPESQPYTPGGGGGGGGAAYGPSNSDQDPYAADDGGADDGSGDEGDDGEEGEQAPAADAPKSKKLPMAPKVPSPLTVAPTMAGDGIPLWMWIGGGVLLAGGAYYYMKKKGIL